MGAAAPGSEPMTGVEGVGVEVPFFSFCQSAFVGVIGSTYGNSSGLVVDVKNLLLRGGVEAVYPRGLVFARFTSHATHFCPTPVWRTRL